MPLRRIRGENSQRLTPEKAQRPLILCVLERLVMQSEAESALLTPPSRLTLVRVTICPSGPHSRPAQPINLQHLHESHRHHS